MVDQSKASRLAKADFELWQAGMLEESVSKYREALECADPDHYMIDTYHGEFAAVLARLGREMEAREQYELALTQALHQDETAHGPGVSLARYLLGEHLLTMGEAARALGIVQDEAVQASEQAWLVRMVEAKALWALGRHS